MIASLKQSKWDERIAPTAEEEYASLLNVLNWTEGFGLVFVQCAPAQGEQLIKRVREDLPQKRIESMNLSKEIKNLYERVEDVAKYTKPNILFIRGIENSFVPYIKSGFGGQGDYYKLDSVPPILNHLNLQRERFRSSTQICLVFLLPLFGMKYFIQRAPDFFDWRSGLFEIAADKDIANAAAREINFAGDYSEYQRWTFSKRIKRILEIETYLTEEIDLDNKVNLYFELGVLRFINEDYEEAISSYDKALEIKPDYYEVWGNRGVALNDLGKYEEAIASYDKVLEIKPYDHKARNNRGIALGKLGKYEEAIVSYDKAIEIKPDDYEAWNNRGVTLGNIGRNEEAIVSYNKAIEIKPDDQDAWINRGHALFIMGRYEEANVSYDKSLEIKPDKHEVWNNRGVALAYLCRYEEAIASYDKALEIKPNDHNALCNRGAALGILGRNEEAIVSYDKALEIKPNDHNALCNRGAALGNIGRNEEAISYYDKALQINPNDPNVYFNKACAYSLQNQIELALENLQKAIQLAPEKYLEMAKTDSDFDSIRHDPRFQELIQ